MSYSSFSPSAYPASDLMSKQTAVDKLPETTEVPSSGMARDMVRGLALMLVAAIMAALVMLTDRLLLDHIDVGVWLGWLVLWSVLLSALLLLSRMSVHLSQEVLTWLDRAARKTARARAQARANAEASQVNMVTH
jgi:hypothetical protein